MTETNSQPKAMFQPGQTVYLPDGREAIYVGLVEGGDHAIRPVYVRDPDDYGDYGGEDPDEDIFGHVTLSREIYANPVFPKIAQQYQDLVKSNADLRSKAQDLRSEISSLELNKKEVIKRAGDYPCIQHTLDFIEGRFTHAVVIEWNGPQIVTLNEALTYLEDKREKGMKMLGLFGTEKYRLGTPPYRLKDRKMEWKVNRYSDGSGSWSLVIPCYSEQEAHEKVQEIVNQNIDAWRSDDKPEIKIDVEKTKSQYSWVELPEDWVTHRKKKAEGEIKQKIDQLQAQIDKYRSELQE
jgi:hypothetical protein